MPGPPTVLQARLVQGLCLALHELAVNSVKYGALRGAGGEARINWKIRDGRCTLHWREDSVAAVAAPPGYGSSLVAGALPDEPDIGVRYSMGADGVHAVFSWRAPVVAPPLEQRAL